MFNLFDFPFHVVCPNFEVNVPSKSIYHILLTTKSKWLCEKSIYEKLKSQIACFILNRFLSKKTNPENLSHNFFIVAYCRWRFIATLFLSREEVSFDTYYYIVLRSIQKWTNFVCLFWCFCFCFNIISIVFNPVFKKDNSSEFDNIGFV